jgi:hypothetical protein
MPPRSQEEMNSKFDLWDIQGISREEQDWLGRMHGFYERPLVFSVLQWRRDCRQETKRKWTSCFVSGIGNSAAWSRTNWLA